MFTRSEKAFRDASALVALAEFMRGHRHDENDREALTDAAIAWGNEMVKADRRARGPK